MVGKVLFILSLVSFLSLGVFYFASASTAIFSDGFENDFSEWTVNDVKWTTSGTTSATGLHSGEKRAQVTGVTEPGDDLLLKNISTLGSSNLKLEFWYRIYKGLEDEDHVYVEWTGDGSSWELLNDFTLVGDSTVWEFASYNLPDGANDKPNFSIRFRAHLGAASSDIFYLDDVVLSGDGQSSNPTPTPTTTPLSAATPTPTPVPTPTPTLSPTSTPTPPSPSPAPTKTPSPLPPAQPTASPSPSPQPKASPTSLIKSSATPSFSPVKNEQDGGLAIASSSDSREIEPTPQEFVNDSSQDLDPAEKSESTSNLSASISGFFGGSKSPWLIGIMVMAVVFSLSKFKN